MLHAFLHDQKVEGGLGLEQNVCDAMLILTLRV